MRENRALATAWTTRSETAADAAAIRAVNIAAFPSEEEADLVDALRASEAWIDGLSMVAEDSEGTVVAHALLTRCHVDGVPALALALLRCATARPKNGGRLGGHPGRSGRRPRAR